MPALGMKLKRSHRRGAVVSGVRRRRLTACPTIYSTEEYCTDAGGNTWTCLTDTNGWNEWSASCVMGSQYSFEEVTVKIKKSSSMSGELIIEMNNNHFALTNSALELEDVTLTGGSAAVSFFVLCIVVNTYMYSFFDSSSDLYNSVNDNKNVFVDFLMFIDSYYFFYSSCTSFVSIIDHLFCWWCLYVTVTLNDVNNTSCFVLVLTILPTEWWCCVH